MPPKVLQPTNSDKRKADDVPVTKASKRLVTSSSSNWQSHRSVCAPTGSVDERLKALEGQLEPLNEPWPARALVFKCWKLSKNKDERDSLLMDVLETRGWTNGGCPCSKEDMNELPLLVHGKHPTEKLPRRAFYVCGDDAEARVLHGLPGTGQQYRVSGFPGAEPACYKTSVAKCLGGMPFVPETYVLPSESEALMTAAARDKKAKAPSFWLMKPRNEYAGRGITVFEGSTAQFEASAQTSKLGVVQRYLNNPMLVGGYKFHMRLYLLVTECEPTPRAYIHSDGHVMFCTMKYEGCPPSSIGENFGECAAATHHPRRRRTPPGRVGLPSVSPPPSPLPTPPPVDAFSLLRLLALCLNSSPARPRCVPWTEPRRHLSNYDINCTPQNMPNYLDPKVRPTTRSGYRHPPPHPWPRPLAQPSVCLTACVPNRLRAPTPTMRQGGETAGVGSGCCWGMRRLERWLTRYRKDVSVAAIWHQIHVICHHITRAIATYPTIRKFKPTTDRCSELFGLDLMLDDDAKVRPRRSPRRVSSSRRGGRVRDEERERRVRRLGVIWAARRRRLGGATPHGWCAEPFGGVCPLVCCRHVARSTGVAA